MGDNKLTKGGFTIKEMEHLARKYRFEVFYCAAFVLAVIFSKAFSMMGFSLILAAAGGIVGMLLPGRTDRIVHIVLEFVCKQEKIMQLVMGIGLLVISVLLPPITFFALCITGGVDLHRNTIIQRNKFVGNHSDSENKHS